MTSKFLKQKQDDLQEGLPDEMRLRVRRSLSWLERAEMEADDHDAAFIFYWIAFNAAYAEDRPDAYEESERAARNRFFARISRLDTNKQVDFAVWERLSGSIRRILNNRYVFQPFWRHHNQVPGYEDWADSFARSREATDDALAAGNTNAVLTSLFDRLYVLRDQLLHGGATWNGSVNRRQVSDGATIMAFLVPPIAQPDDGPPGSYLGCPLLSRGEPAGTLAAPRLCTAPSRRCSPAEVRRPDGLPPPSFRRRPKSRTAMNWKPDRHNVGVELR